MSLKEIITEKKCSNTTCLKTGPIPVSEFAKRSDTTDGLQSWCKTCIANNKKLWREKNKNNNETFNCTLCSIVYSSKDSLTRHIRKKHK